MSMTDEAVKKIAESTIKKYENADRKALIVVLNDDGSADLCSNMDGYNVMRMGVMIVAEIAGEAAEAVFKDAAKEAKRLKKAREKDAKH